MVLQKILVVDDSELLHRMYDLILMRYSHAGTTILHATDGSQAMSMIETESDIDLVLLDINMPVMNGIQVLNALRETGFLRRLTVIMVSTMGQEEQMERAVAGGASAYVTKPFTPARLHELIDTRFGTDIAAERKAN